MIALGTMPYNGVGQTYVVLSRPAGSMVYGKFTNTLRFKVKEIDPTSGTAPPCLPVVLLSTSHLHAVPKRRLPQFASLSPLPYSFHWL